jgi:glycosyltransferase involved in cell wall biosynthesis
MDLLYGGLREHGVDCVAEPPLTFRWLARARNNVDVLHFHWRPDRYYAWYRRLGLGTSRRRPRTQNLRSWLRLGLFACRLRVARLLGFRLVWTIHELYPPQTSTMPNGAVSRQVDQVGSRLLAGSCDLLLAHDRVTADRARQEFGEPFEQVEVVPHPSYLGVYRADRPSGVVRKDLGIAADTFVFLCFGALRPDKSIGLVVDAFLGIERSDVALVVAGVVEDLPSCDALLAAAALDERIRPLLGFVPHDRVGELHAVAQACVLGRREPWTSGSMILALSLGVPIVAADVPPYDELTAAGRAGWLYRPGEAESLREAMCEAVADPARAREKGRAALEQARRLPTWSQTGERTAALILQHCAGGRRRSTDSATARSAGVFTP